MKLDDPSTFRMFLASPSLFLWFLIWAAMHVFPDYVVRVSTLPRLNSTLLVEFERAKHGDPLHKARERKNNKDSMMG